MERDDRFIQTGPAERVAFGNAPPERIGTHQETPESEAKPGIYDRTQDVDDVGATFTRDDEPSVEESSPMLPRAADHVDVTPLARRGWQDGGT
jgi:hypothetical protein